MTLTSHINQPKSLSQAVRRGPNCYFFAPKNLFFFFFAGCFHDLKKKTRDPPTTATGELTSADVARVQAARALAPVGAHPGSFSEHALRLWTNIQDLQARPKPN